MIYIQSAFSQDEQRLELVGRQGEGGTRQLVFDCADVLAEYPDALIVCAMQRAGDHTAYLKDCATDGTNRAVTLESADVAMSGILKIELRALIGDDVRKSAVYIAKVAESLRGAQDRPGNPIADVLNRIDMTISRAEESIAEADAAAKSAQTVADTVQAKLDNGDFVGPAGKPGSDASVTADNIRAALGYTPVKDVHLNGESLVQDSTATIPLAGYNRLGAVQLDPAGFAAASVEGKLALVPPTDAQISTHTHTQRPITPSCMDYAVKAAMCDGKGAAWAEAEQKAARERMGIDKPYELIEKIVIQEAVSYISRDLSLKTLYIEMVMPDTADADGADQYITIEIDNTQYGVWLGKTIVAGQTRYAKFHAEKKHGRYMTTAYIAGTLKEALTPYFQHNSTGIIGLKINKIHFYNALLTAGTEIAIYGVRA